MSDGRVEFDVVGNTRGIRSAIDEATSHIEQQTRRWDDAAEEASDGMESKFSSALKKIVAGFSAVKIGKALLDFGKDAVQAASDLEEVQNVVDVTFGAEGAAKIQSWADQAGKSFGLTETQAKKFTSTLGAMMKSAGMAGPEIVSMSTDLAGLAADMASFYNLDFETAFQKIRSGISGETEPLKQLGINMSVANLEAYALSQGISKAFDKMSQSEQTMLRYQYLMQATADAQGDFARTSDGYANSLRTMETNIESLKTKLGTVLVPAISEAVGWVNTLIENLTPTERQPTYMDQIAAIDLKKSAKLEEINLIKTQADELIKVLEGLGVPSTAGTDLENIAKGANLLKADAPGIWSNLLTTFTKMDGLENLFKDSTGKDNITDIARALSGANLDQSKAEAWKAFLGALSENAGAVSTLTGDSVAGTKDWLDGLSESVDGIDPDDVGAWDELLGVLVSGLSVTPEGQAFAESISTLSTGANGLDSSSVETWNGLFGALQNIDGLQNIFSNNSAGKNVEDLAKALSSSTVSMDRATAWKTFLEALSGNADALTSLTGKSSGDTKKWLEDMAAAANELDPNAADGWDKLLGNLLQGLPGLADTEEGRQFLEGLTTSFLSMGTESEEGTAGLRALGLSTDEIEQKQATWLATCKELVRTIPGLSSIIDTTTGEIQGGIPALKDYADQWERTAKYQAEVESIRAKRDVYESMTDPNTLQAESVVKRAEATAKLKVSGFSEAEIQSNLDNLDTLIQKVVDADLTWKQAKEDMFDVKNLWGDVDAVSSATVTYFASNKAGIDSKELDWYNKLRGDAEEAVLAYAEALYKEKQTEKERPLVLADIEASEGKVAEAYGVTTAELEAQAAAADDAADKLSVLEKAAQGDADATKQVTEAVNNANDALKAMADYAENVHKAVESSVNNTVKGFEKVKSPSAEAVKKASDLAEKLAAMGERTEKNAKEWDKLNAQIQEYNSQTVTASGMEKGLQSQLDFMDDYLAAFEAAKAMGLSTDMLSFLADGSMESYEWLKELTDPKNAEAAGEISKKWDEVQQKKKSFTDTLAANQLSMDETYTQLQAKAAEAVAALNLQGEAAENTGKTMQGIAEGISSNVPAVASAVDSILAELNRLNSFGISINLGNWGSISWTMPDIASNAKGLDYVPFDGYLSELHEGEGILTAEENRVWQNFKRGGMTTRNTDYDTLGSVIGDNTRTGGNVYLEGRVVGQVISDVQGRSYRSLKRSGWKS